MHLTWSGYRTYFRPICILLFTPGWLGGHCGPVAPDRLGKPLFVFLPPRGMEFFLKQVSDIFVAIFKSLNLTFVNVGKLLLLYFNYFFQTIKLD